MRGASASLSELRSASADAWPHEDGDGALWCAVVAIGTFLVFCGLVAFSPRGPTYDEPWYLGTVSLLEAHGLGANFFRSLPGPAGPLYTVVHYLLKPITMLEVPGVRVVNLFLTAATVPVLALCIKQLRSNTMQWSSLDLLCVPGLGACAALALTEVPAMFFVTVSLLLLLIGLRRAAEHPVSALAISAVGGACLGLAILGRQPYLLLLLAVPIWSIARQTWRIPVLLTFSGAAMTVCLPVFLAWGGLVPPQIVRVGEGIAPAHGALAAAYAAVIMLVLAPRYLAMPPRWVLGIFAVGFGVNAVAKIIQITPLSTVVARALSPDLAAAYTSLVSGIFLGAAFLFVAATLRNAWQQRQQPAFLFFAAAASLIVASSAKVTHQPSSRYVIVAAPMLVVLGAYYSRPSRWRALRLGIGSAISVLSVWSYLYP